MHLYSWINKPEQQTDAQCEQGNGAFATGIVKFTLHKEKEDSSIRATYWNC